MSEWSNIKLLTASSMSDGKCDEKNHFIWMKNFSIVFFMENNILTHKPKKQVWFTVKWKCTPTYATLKRLAIFSICFIEISTANTRNNHTRKHLWASYVAYFLDAIVNRMQYTLENRPPYESILNERPKILLHVWNCWK